MRESGSETRNPARIDDFGEHIPGARKDESTRGLARGMNADPQYAGTLAVAWPLPQWSRIAAAHAEKGRDRVDLATVRALRDQLRTRSGRNFERASATTLAPKRFGLRALALGILEERWNPQEALEAISERSAYVAQEAEKLAVLYAEVGHGTDLAGTRIDSRPDGSRWFIRRRANHRTTSTSGATLVDAARELAVILASEREARKNGSDRGRASPYSVRYVEEDGEKVYGVYRRIAGRWTKVRECGGLAEARRIVGEDTEKLDQWWEAWRTIPAERRKENAARSPAGGHGTSEPADFEAQFGFRGVQFGNWVENARRKADLMETSEALCDLARVLGWPERALSLGGRLGLAFGARGRGGAQGVRAHYEPLQRVVAISKPSGPGTLAHEWFHALDHHVTLLADRSGFATEELGRTPDDTELGGLAAALAAYGAALRTSRMAARSKRLDTRRPRSNPYWGTVRELAARAFEAWVVDRLAELGIRNDYLVNFKPPEEWPGTKEMDQGYPYPYADERLELAPYIARIGWSGGRMAERWTTEAGEAVRRGSAADEPRSADANMEKAAGDALSRARSR